MRAYTLPDGKTIDLDSISWVDPLFVNKNDANFNCYEIHLNGGQSFGVFEKDLAREQFVSEWTSASG